jgi:thiol-disulfide isomerase/thioredoxin
MNRIFQKLMAGLLAVSLFALSACSEKPGQEAIASPENAPESGVLETVTINGLVYQHIIDDVMGISLDIPKEAYENWTILYGPFSQEGEKQEYSPIDGSFLQFAAMTFRSSMLFIVQYYAETDWDTWTNEGKTASSITGYATNEEISREGGMVYIYSEPEPDESGMDDKTVKAYREMLDLLPTIKGSIQLIPRASELKVSLPAFAAADLDGNLIDSTLFGEYKLVMLNFWATFCGPCIDEMPDLQEMSGSMPEGTLLAGVVGDALSDGYIELAKEIASEAKVTYLNIVPDQALSDYINNNIVGYPTTIFIDAKGNIVGDVLVGKHSKEEYEAELTKRLDNLEDDNSNGVQTEDSKQSDDGVLPEISAQPGNTVRPESGNQYENGPQPSDVYTNPSQPGAAPAPAR